MKVITVKFGQGSEGEWVGNGHKTRFSLEVWFSCNEQEDFFFSLGNTGLGAKRCREKLSAGRRRALS